MKSIKSLVPLLLTVYTQTTVFCMKTSMQALETFMTPGPTALVTLVLVSGAKIVGIAT